MILQKLLLVVIGNVRSSDEEQATAMIIFEFPVSCFWHCVAESIVKLLMYHNGSHGQMWRQYALHVTVSAVCAIHAVVCLQLFFAIVCCAIDTLANIYAGKAVMCMCLYWGRWGACENICTTSHSCYGNVCCVILWQNKQTGIEQTNRHLEDKMHQTEAGVNGMAMTSRAENLNYLFDAAKEKFGCFPKQRVYLLAYLIVFWKNLRICGLFAAIVLFLWEANLII